MLVPWAILCFGMASTASLFERGIAGKSERKNLLAKVPCNPLKSLDFGQANRRESKEIHT